MSLVKSSIPRPTDIMFCMSCFSKQDRVEKENKKSSKIIGSTTTEETYCSRSIMGKIDEEQETCGINN